MKKFFKNLFWFTFWTGLIAFGLKIFSMIKAVITLDKTLPLYLGNITEETPKVKINYTFRKLNLDVQFSKKILKKFNDLETMILDYINDFYPNFTKCEININLEETEEIQEEKAKEDKVKEKSKNEVSAEKATEKSK